MLDNNTEAESEGHIPGRDLLVFGSEPLWTPAIQALAGNVAHWIRNDLPGACVYGIPQIGKSFCCRYLKKIIPAMLGHTSIAVLWSTELVNAKGELETLRDYLKQSGSNAVGHSKVGIIKSRLFDHLIGLADSQRAKRIVIIVDEAHRMEWMHLQILMVVVNHLNGMDKLCFTLLVGEPTLKDLRTTFLNKESMQMRGRFFFAEYQFGAIALSNLEELFSAIDDDREISTKYLRGKLPDGARLVDFAPLYRNAVLQIAAAKNIPAPPLPMPFIRTTLNSIIYLIIESADPVEVSVDLVRQALLETDFDEVMSLYVEEPPEEKNSEEGSA